MSDFTYLSIHTHFSRAGGPASPLAWCERARQLGFTSIGIADRSPLAGWPAMHQAACQSGLGLVYGMEADIALPPDSPRKGKAPAEPAIQGALLLARSPEGARNLARLASVAYADWPARETAIPWDALSAHTEGLVHILLGGDEAGALQPIAEGEARKADAWATALKSAFQDSLYVGLPHSGRPGDTALCEAIASRAGALSLPLAALPSVRYFQPGDAPAYEALKLARMSAGWPRESAAPTSIAADRHGFDFLRSPDEAVALYNRWPEAIQNAISIATQAAQHDRWPFDVPDPNQGHATLRETAERRLQQLLGVDTLPPEAHDRLSSEISAMTGWGPAGAWTALAALASRAQDAQQPVPYAPLTQDSLLTYALGITPGNPTDTQSPDAQTAPPPHPTITLPSQGRASLLQGLAEEYGQDRIAHAACPLDITPTQALAASASVLDLDSDFLRGLIPPVMDKGWQALKDHSADGPTSNVAALALSLEGAPLVFVSDHDAALAAPRAVYGSATLASWSPLLQPIAGDHSSLVTRHPSLAWTPWSPESLAHLSYPTIHLSSSPDLDALHTAMQLALRYPLPGLNLPTASSEPDKLTAALKSQHPPAYFAGFLGAAWRRGSASAVARLADEARKLNIRLEPPHVNFSLEYPTLQRDGEAWSVLWGLATLPGWSAASTTNFVNGRSAEGFSSLASVVEVALSSGLGIPPLSALIMAGACDTLGDRPRDRQALLSALPSLFDWATTQAKSRDTASNQLDLFSAPAIPPPIEDDLREDNSQTSFQVAHTSHSPYERYLRRQWERENLGVAFTEAGEIDMLISALEASGDLRSRLISTSGVGPEQIGNTIHIVGLLCEITLLKAEDGDALAVGALHDPYGTLEVVAFPPNYKRHAPLWVENNLVAVTARVQAHQDGALYLLCEHLAPFTAANEETYSVTIKTRAAKSASPSASETPQPARPDLRLVAPPPDTHRPPQPSMPSQPPAFTLIISIPDADEDQTVIDSVIGLKRLLQEYPGPDTVTIRVPYIRGKWTSASLSWGVRYSHQLESRIRRLLGDDAIAVIQLAS